MSQPTFATKTAGRRYRFPDIEGVEFPSVTTLIGLLDKPALSRWQRVKVAEYAVDYQTSWAGLPRDDAIELLRESPWRETKRAGNRGTDAHEFLETDQMPPEDHPTRRYVEAGRDWQTAEVSRIHLREVTMRDPVARYAGTADVVCDLWTGELAIADYKTSRTSGYLEQALQLVALGRCPELVANDGTVTTWSQPPELGVVVHLLPDATFETYTIDFDSEAAEMLHQAFLGLVAVWDAQQAWGNGGSWLPR